MKKVIQSALSALLLLIPTFSYGTTNQALRLVHPKTGHIFEVLADTHLDKKGGKVTAIQRNCMIAAAQKYKNEHKKVRMVSEDGYAISMDTFRNFGLSTNLIKSIETFYTSARKHFLEEGDDAAPYRLKFAAIKTPINPIYYIKKEWSQGYYYAPFNGLHDICASHDIPSSAFSFLIIRDAATHDTSITIKDVVDFEQAFIEHLRTNAHRTDAVFHSYYQRCINNYYAEPGVKQLIALADTNPTLSYAEAQRIIGADTLLANNLELMHASLIYTVAKDLALYDATIVCAGQFHTDALLPALYAAGFELVDHCGQLIVEGAYDDDQRYCILPVVNLKQFFNL